MGNVFAFSCFMSRWTRECSTPRPVEKEHWELAAWEGVQRVDQNQHSIIDKADQHNPTWESQSSVIYAYKYLPCCGSHFRRINIFMFKVVIMLKERQVVLFHVMKISGDIASFETRWVWPDSAALFPGKCPRQQFNMRRGGPQSRSMRRAEQEHLFPWQKSNFFRSTFLDSTISYSTLYDFSSWQRVVKKLKQTSGVPDWKRRKQVIRANAWIGITQLFSEREDKLLLCILPSLQNRYILQQRHSQLKCTAT
jgi:hypothetical protein